MSRIVEVRQLDMGRRVRIKFEINDLTESGGGGDRTRVLEQGLDRFYKFVRADIVGRQVVARLTPYP